MKLVVDASVAVKWLIPEEHSEIAASLLQADYELWAPDLIWSEIGNILWKRHRQRELTREEGTLTLELLARIDLRIHGANLLAGQAWEFASLLDRTFYDSVYLALATLQRCPLVTADRRLYNALASTPLKSLLVWVGDLS